MTAGALALTDAERRVAERVDPAATNALTVSAERGGVAFANAGQLMEFAKLMAVSSAGVRKHLRGNPGACLAICTQAVEWGMSPYAVANNSYFVNDQIAFESKLVQAVILKRAPIKGRIRFEYTGEGDERRCRAWARLADEPDEIVDYLSPPLGKITPKNSPLWKSDSDQQLAYYSGRALCRRHFPDVLLGVYADDEIEPTPRGPEQARDVTPTGLAGRLDALAALKPAAAPAPIQAGVGNFPDQLDAEGGGSDVDQGDEAFPGDTPLDPPAAREPGADEDAGDDEPTIDPTDPDYVRGAETARRGAKKCLNPDITADPRRMAVWKAGFDSVAAEG
ncbi:MAG: recombinase RecT [Methylobacterium sp.]|uniref:recombinase RecT n=1 Tax=Methylobacterium sp. TaxID=409 RepID=UPI00258ABD34|nr:recombinase RecT [Methylobacterium sp.]MBY0297448.1 recombinase RecT [Methylobacterium sp.]